MSPHPSEVFLSHSSVDRSIADEVADLLRRHGIPLWYSPTEIRGAQQWHDEIGDALKRCDWFVVLLSPNSVVSPWVKRELMFALKEQRYADKMLTN
jgi:TIR domain